MLSATILNDLKTKNYSRIRGQLRLTKTAENYSDILISRDRDLEKQTISWLQERTNANVIFRRYQSYDPKLKDLSWPQHYPVQILSGIGSACSGKNIFMFFPYVLNQKPKDESDVFGLEFIDVWLNIFRSVIFPIANRVFTKETLVNLLSLQKNLEKTVYLASIFHEIGHRCGPYKVSPHLSPKIKLSPFQVDIMGELSTDSLLIKHLSEFPEILQFVVLQRLFWFGRKGFRHDPVSADLNTDNDTWIGSMLWQSFLSNKIITKQGQQFHINFPAAREFFKEIISEIDCIKLEGLEADEQQTVMDEWMKIKVPYLDEKFVLPEDLKNIFQQTQDIEETPHFQTLYTYTLINELNGAIENEI